MESTWPTAPLVHLPVHTTWLNHVEIYVSIVQRRAINFDHLHRLSAYEPVLAV